MNDRELLERAATAAGITLAWSSNEDQSPRNTDGWNVWNPLTDDSDALRLAVKLGFSVNQVQGRQQASCISPTDVRGAYVEPYDGDPYAATRRAIVRAAAEMAP